VLAGVLGCTALVGCGDDGRDPFVRSCAGFAVDNCRVPYGASRVVSATATPDGLAVDDFDASLRVEVTLETCERDDIPRPHRITVFALVAPDGLPVDPLDGGTPSNRLELLGRFQDDGEGDDETERDGMAMGTLPPTVFDSDRGIPPSSDIQIRVQSAIFDPNPPAVIGGDSFTCQSEPRSIDYRTGPLAPRP